MSLNLKKLREMQGRMVTVHEVYESLSPEEKGIRFVESIRVQGQAVHRDRVIFLDVRIQATAVQPCSRCLGDVISPLDWEEHLEFQPDENGGLWEREAFTYSLHETELNLYPYIMGLIGGVLDPKPLCRPDCKGLCPVCGQNLNVGECACAARREGDPRLKVLKELLE